jgi:hypothetical protein
LAAVEARGLVLVVLVGVVLEAGVAGALRTPGGLVNEERDVVVVVLLAGVEAEVAEGRVVVVVGGAIDIRLGRAEMPSFLSSDASTELREVRLRWDGVLEAVVEVVGFFTVETAGRAGGLLRVVVGDAVFEAEVLVGLVNVEVRGATG